MIPPKTLIAFHLMDLSGGGVEKMRLALAQELVARGFDVDIVLCRSSGPYMSMLPQGVRVIDLNTSRTRSSIWPLMKYLRKMRPAVLVSSMGPQNIASLIANKLAGSPSKVFVTQHNALSVQATSMRSFQQALVPFLYRIFLPFADGIIAVSKGVAGDLSKVTRIPIERIHVLYNPAYPEDLDEKLKQTVNDEIFETDEPVLVAVGRLIHQKGFDTLIESVSLLNNAMAVRLVILGHGPLLLDLQTKIDRLGLQEKIKLVGFKENPLPYINKAALFVMSSRYEGFGNVLVEALACGTPVLSTDCCFGPNEILEGGNFGSLVPVDDVAAMAASIAQALKSSPPPSILKQRAAAFSVQTVTSEYLKVLFWKTPGKEGT